MCKKISEKATTEISSVNLTPLYILQHLPIHVPLPLHGLQDQNNKLLLAPDSIVTNCEGGLILLLCKECCCALRLKTISSLSLANLNYLGPIPQELSDLTAIEEAMIVQSCTKCWIVQLIQESCGINLPNTQQGHIIVYPQ